jgi:hypothetical protein
LALLSSKIAQNTGFRAVARLLVENFNQMDDGKVSGSEFKRPRGRPRRPPEIKTSSCTFIVSFPLATCFVKSLDFAASSISDHSNGSADMKISPVSAGDLVFVHVHV